MLPYMKKKKGKTHFTKYIINADGNEKKDDENQILNNHPKTDIEEKENKETIFWVDQNIKNNENQQYCYKIYSKYGINVKEFIDLNSLFEKMKLIKFDIVFIIISGRLIEDYLNLFKEQIDSLYIIPIHIIFTNHKDIIINLLKEKYSEDLNNYLINIENVASSYKGVKNIVKENGQK